MANAESSQHRLGYFAETRADWACASGQAQPSVERCSGYSAGAWLPHPRGDSQRRALWRATAKKAAVRHRLEGRGGKGG